MNKKIIYEVEKKYKIDQNRREKLINFLNEKAKLIEKKHEVDTYFNIVGRDSLSTKECLRIRETDSFSEITYKPSSFCGNMGTRRNYRHPAWCCPQLEGWKEHCHSGGYSPQK